MGSIGELFSNVLISVSFIILKITEDFKEALMLWVIPISVYHIAN